MKLPKIKSLINIKSRFLPITFLVVCTLCLTVVIALNSSKYIDEMQFRINPSVILNGDQPLSKYQKKLLDEKIEEFKKSGKEDLEKLAESGVVKEGTAEYVKDGNYYVFEYSNGTKGVLLFGLDGE